MSKLRNKMSFASAGSHKSSFRTLMKMRLQQAIVGSAQDLKSIEELAADEDVEYVELDKLNKLYTVEGRALVGSDDVAANGYTGEGVGVVIIDSSFDLLHPELGGSTSLPNGTVFAGKNFSDPGTSIHSRVMDDCYHGTGTASIIKRYAPEADLYALTVFPNAYDSVIADAIDWAVANKNGVNGGAPIKVISMSLGGGQYYSACNSGTLHDAAGRAVANGIIVFAASGNDGWTNSMGNPACSSNVISVGSTWDKNNASYSAFPPAYCSDSNRQVNERTCYSDTASFLDIYAPSEEVICAKCGGGTFALGGTSSACPAAAGMTAQLLHAKPELSGDKDEIVSLYQETGIQVIGDTSKRRIDLEAAIYGDNGGTDGDNDGGSDGDGDTLQNGDTVSLSLSSDETQTFTISIPANTSSLTVSTSGNGDIDLYVKSSAVNWPGDKGSHDNDTFKSPYRWGSSESVTFSYPDQGTWHVLVHGYDASTGSITATWETSSVDGDGDGDEDGDLDGDLDGDTDGDIDGDTDGDGDNDIYCEVFSSTNYSHVVSGRATTTFWGLFAVAVGSGDSLGYTYSGSSTLYEAPEGYFSLSSCE